ncbi:MAG: tetratricopeptide repeat protein [Deltaproteobacteria bacterium]|nr:tetratricopeptide repeat protein [Deltaproteobacteria bacterium]
MPPKKDKPMFDTDDLSKTMSREEADKELNGFLKRLEDEFKNTPKELIEVGAERVIDFIKGNITWADMFNLPKKTMREMVEYGYLQFQSGRYQEAERFFKVLTVLDWQNSYYHSMMGSILKAQKRFGEAIAEYSEAIKLNPNDTVSFVNRGEIYMQHKLFDDAVADFDKAIALDPKKESKWANRARVLKNQIEQIIKAKPPVKEKGGTKAKKAKKK